MLLLRRLCPRFIYPGRDRVGSPLADIHYPVDVPVFDGLDWYWGPSLVRAKRFLRRTRPDVVVLQWWTGTVAHTYLLLAWWLRRRGSRLIVEFHEVLDVSEATLPIVVRYVRWTMQHLLRWADGVVVHSEHDAAAVAATYRIPPEVPIAVIPHGPYDQYAASASDLSRTLTPTAVDGRLRLLYAGVIRPYKGLEDLAGAMAELLARGEDVHLTVVGEVWQGYRAPLERLAELPPERVSIREEFVSDQDFGALFDEADIVVLPYLRSSASGPLHLAMSRGLPVVTTRVGGLVEATARYSGAVLVAAGDMAALADGVCLARGLTGIRHAEPHSWDGIAASFSALFEQVTRKAS